MRYKNLIYSRLAKKIIKHLNGLKTPTQLAKELRKSRQTITDVLSRLYKIGIVQKTKRGKETFYWVNEYKLRKWVERES